MHIKFVEIANFRKLLSIRVDLAESTTLLVGANNSGKTSATVALRKFLSPRPRDFETHDITLCHWPKINSIGQTWLDASSMDMTVDLDSQVWGELLPMLDLWLHVEEDELHYVHNLIPTLDWEAGLLGVRLRLEPKDLSAFYKEFLDASADAKAMKAAAETAAGQMDPDADPTKFASKLTVWPSNLIDFLGRRFANHFTVRAYPLDPAMVVAPSKLQAKLQSLSPDVLAIEGNPLVGLIRVNEISAQRGFGEAQPSDSEQTVQTRPGSKRLSDQLRDYYKKHLDPTDRPDLSDLGALQAIEAAQDAFDKGLPNKKPCQSKLR